MNKTYYKKLVKMIGSISEEADIDFTCYLHDNLWRGNKPVDELNAYIGEGKWIKYMGAPCKRNHATMLYKSGRPRKVDKEQCTCRFPEGPVHAAYNPKMNLVEETFAEIDRQIKRNHVEDQKKDQPIVWPSKGVGKRTFWKKQLEKAVQQVGANGSFFERQYNGYLKSTALYRKSW